MYPSTYTCPYVNTYVDVYVPYTSPYTCVCRRVCVGVLVYAVVTRTRAFSAGIRNVACLTLPLTGKSLLRFCTHVTDALDPDIRAALTGLAGSLAPKVRSLCMHGHTIASVLER